MKKDRTKQVQLYLDVNGRMTYDELLEKLPDVSMMTLRRDIIELEKSGTVLRIKNGALSLTELAKGEGNILNRANKNVFEKQNIAEKAITLVTEGQTLFIDGGSTTIFFARELPDKKFRVLTNGLNIAGELAKKKEVSVYLAGGELKKDNQATCGRRAESALSGEPIDVAVLATSAYSYSDGFTCADREEAELKSFIISRARKRIMLLDRSKIDTTLSYTFAKIENIDVLVVDDEFPADRKAEFKRRGVRVI